MGSTPEVSGSAASELNKMRIERTEKNKLFLKDITWLLLLLSGRTVSTGGAYAKCSPRLKNYVLKGFSGHSEQTCHTSCSNIRTVSVADVGHVADNYLGTIRSSFPSISSVST